MDPADKVALQPGAMLHAIRDLQRRLSWMERQHRMLLIHLMNPGQPVPVCADSRCGWGPVPHVAEQPNCCPWLKIVPPEIPETADAAGEV